MNEFRRLAAKIDRQVEQLAAEGVNDPPAIVNRMMGYVPDLHTIWVGASDDQLMTLSGEYPGFYRYARIMEEASEAERRKPSRSYDGVEEFSAQHKRMATQLLETAATLERGYQASGRSQASQPHLDAMHRRWLSDLERFKNSLRAHGVEPRALGYVEEAFGRFAERIEKLAGPNAVRPEP